MDAPGTYDRPPYKGLQPGTEAELAFQFYLHARSYAEYDFTLRGALQIWKMVTDEGHSLNEYEHQDEEEEEDPVPNRHLFYVEDSPRVQAALDYLFDDAESYLWDENDTSVTFPSTQMERDLVQALALYEGREPVVNGGAVPGGSGSGGKGANGAAAAPIELHDSDSEDEVLAMVRGAVGNAKGKGRAQDVTINLLSDSDDESQCKAHQNLPPRFGTNPQPNAKAAPTMEEMSLASILTIIPDVDPAHVTSLLRQAFYGGKVELIVDLLLTKPDYPKAPTPESSKGKGKKRERSVDLEEKNSRDWMDPEGRDLLGTLYRDAVLEALSEDFDTLSKIDIKRLAAKFSYAYAPSFVELSKIMAIPAGQRPIKTISNRRAPAKGKTKEVLCPEFEKEKLWLRKKLLKEDQEKRLQDAENSAHEAEIARGEFFECGCCFGDVGFSQLVTCTEGCQFCKECFTMHANTQIGLRKFVLPCMNTDGCKAVFPESEARKALIDTTLAALHKIRQEKEVDLAGIDGLAKCPFCPFACIIENPDERLFTCQRDECGIVSCRGCQKVDHLPKTCAEVDQDKKIDGMHLVEEAMTSALIRKCPKCSEPYVKEDGCNKIQCPSCHCTSCYICNKVIAGYSHFTGAGTNATHMDPGAHCALWDDTGARNFQEVEAARIAAGVTVAAQNPALAAEDLKGLHLPPPPPPPKNIAHLPAPVVRAAVPVAGRAPPPAVPRAPAPAPAPARRVGQPPPPPLLRPPPRIDPRKAAVDAQAALAAQAARLTAQAAAIAAQAANMARIAAGQALQQDLRVKAAAQMAVNEERMRKARATAVATQRQEKLDMEKERAAKRERLKKG